MPPLWSVEYSLLVHQRFSPGLLVDCPEMGVWKLGKQNENYKTTCSQALALKHSRYQPAYLLDRASRRTHVHSLWPSGFPPGCQGQKRKIANSCFSVLNVETAFIHEHIYEVVDSQGELIPGLFDRNTLT